MRNSRLDPWPGLAAARRRGRLGHALFLVGTLDETDQAAAALVRTSLCEGAGDPDCACRGCRTDLEHHPDFLRVAAEPKTIRREAMAGALARLTSSPLWAPATVLWIREVDKMTPEAEAFLLRRLEEPPGYGQFILTSERPDGVLATVKSRCQMVPVGVSRNEVTSFAPRQLMDRNRDLAEDVVRAAYFVRAAYAKTPRPGLIALFDRLVAVHAQLEQNGNVELARESVVMEWEAAFGRMR